MRRSSGSCVSGWTTTNGNALLHQQRIPWIQQAAKGVESVKTGKAPASYNAAGAMYFWSLAFDDFSGLDAAGADAHALAATVDLRLDGLKVYVPAAPGRVVGVRDVVAELRAFAAEITFLCHDEFAPISNCRNFPVSNLSASQIGTTEVADTRSVALLPAPAQGAVCRISIIPSISFGGERNSERGDVWLTVWYRAYRV